MELKVRKVESKCLKGEYLKNIKGKKAKIRIHSKRIVISLKTELELSELDGNAMFKVKDPV